MGDSIAVNGICLTACGLGRESFTVDVMGKPFPGHLSRDQGAEVM